MPLYSDILGGYFQAGGNRLYLVGPLHEAPQADPDHFNKRIMPAGIHDLSTRVVRRIPQLERSEAHGGWASLYDVSPDWQPVIGRSPPACSWTRGPAGTESSWPRRWAGTSRTWRWVTDPAIDEFHPRRFEEARVLTAGYRHARILG